MKDLTKEQAEEILREHLSLVRRLMIAWALDSLSMAMQGEQIEKALDIHESDLAKALKQPSRDVQQASSNYMTILENALKGQLTPVSPVNEEWSDTIG